MIRKFLKSAAMAAVTIAATAQVGSASACMPLGEPGARGGGSAVMSDGANVALYEWSPAHHAAVLVARWFDPDASSLPPDPDEVDLTDQFFNSTLACGWEPSPPGRPPTLPMVNAIRGPGNGLHFLVRSSTNNGSGAPIALARIIGGEATVTNGTSCSAGEAADAAACQAIRRASPIVATGSQWLVHFADGQSRPYIITSPFASLCAMPIGACR
jgi:hypothetical protein